MVLMERQPNNAINGKKDQGLTTEGTEGTEKGRVTATANGKGKGFNAEDAEGAEGGWVKAIFFSVYFY
jgi:hypothetical protein